MSGIAEQNLLFFNKNGNALNFNFNSNSDIYEGKLFFDENSDDTYKSLSIFTFEKIEPFEFSLYDEVTKKDFIYLNKFQLFNEYGIDFTGSDFNNEVITKIEPVNSDISFFSKFIYGNDFESKFPIGSEITFNDNVTEFGNSNISYTVVATKKGAIMIISNLNNKLYSQQFGSVDFSISDNYTISGLNSIQIRKYVDTNLDPNISDWSEPFFYDKLVISQKLNIVNTEYNDGIVTINNLLLDNTNYTFSANKDNLAGKLISRVTLLTDVPSIYIGILIITQNKISFSINTVPGVLMPGTKFNISNSLNNTLGEYTVDDIIYFDITPGMLYTVGMQCVYDGSIYECITSYVQDPIINVVPTTIGYWKLSTYIPVVENLINEESTNGEISLNDNVIYFDTEFDTDANITMAEFYTIYANDFLSLGLNLTYDNFDIIADTLYSSKYVDVKFFSGDISNDITDDIVNFEKVISVSEKLMTEYNVDISEKLGWGIIFDDVDEFGISININGIKYYSDYVVYMNNDGTVNNERSIDNTIRNWKSLHYQKLYKLGIIVELVNNSFYPTSYINGIKLATEFPNIPLNFIVEIGTTASYKIQQYTYTIYDMSGVINITINGVLYTQEFDTSISNTLSSFVTNYAKFLFEFDILVESNNQLLNFYSLQQDTLININVNLGIDPKPGTLLMKTDDLSFGNVGCIITSNQIVSSGNPSQSGEFSFEDECFATGQLISVNNSNWVLENTEYNILQLDPNVIVLSYEGPFWGNYNDDVFNGFLGYAFDDGYGYDPNVPNISVPITEPFKLNVVGTMSNLVDIDYVTPTVTQYVLGDDLMILDGKDLSSINLIDIPNSIKSEVNGVDQFLYVLSDNLIYKVDTILDIVSSTVSLNNTGYDITINQNNGDAYVTYTDSQNLSIYNQLGILTNITLGGDSNNIEFDLNENRLFACKIGGNTITEVDADYNVITNTYTINGLISDLYYNEINNKVYGIDNTSLFTVSDGVVEYINDVPSSTFSSFVVDPTTAKMYISLDDDKLYVLTGDDEVIKAANILDHGNLLYSNIDGNIYLASQLMPRINVVSVLTDNTFITFDTGSILDKLSYNQYRNSVIGISVSDNLIVEIEINVNNPIIRGFSSAFSSAYWHNKIDDDCGDIEELAVVPMQYGSLGDDCDDEANNYLLLKTREYLRKPRENYETDNDKQVSYKWVWELSTVLDNISDIFMYDFSGDFLDKTGPYKYTGITPLQNIRLNDVKNTNINRTNDSIFQQTVFDSLSYELPYVDSSVDLNIVPEPIPLYIGFNSLNEGVTERTLLLKKVEDITFNININSVDNTNILHFYSDDYYNYIKFNVNSTSVFTNRNLKIGQHILVNISDDTNSFNQYTSSNNGKAFKIVGVYAKELKLISIPNEGSIYADFVDEYNVINDYPGSGYTTYMSTKFTVIERTLGRFMLFGQTEIEDIRYKIELNNTGKNIAREDIYIFKEYDINEQGIDWVYLNAKRREMLLNRNDIYNYIGSYKSIINAINYFGYNDLDLYEYYKNININSLDYGKLVKIEIPDIFDNSVNGWNENAFVLNTFPNKNYAITNSFNLSYRITDINGNNLLTYSLDETIVKLFGLKRWLKDNIIPLSHDILDITGRVDVPNTTYIVHDTYDTTHLKNNNSLTPVTFTIPESYVMPVNSGSTVYNTVIKFALDIDDYLPDYYNITIKTYKTYNEWEPFINYTIGDKILYYGNIYESAVVNNKTNNPKQFDNVSDWTSYNIYSFGSVVKYKGNIYQYLNANDTTSGIKPTQNVDWSMINEWSIIDLVPVQTINEFRDIDNLQDFLFTIDTKIDPYVIINVTSDDGYGAIYTMRKSVEIKFDADSSSVILLD